MKQKNAFPNKEQQEILRRHKMDPLQWVVVKDMKYCLIVKNRETGEYETITKTGGKPCLKR